MRAQTCSAVAAVFEATVATLGRAREGGQPHPWPWQFPLFTTGSWKGEKTALGHLSNPGGCPFSPLQPLTPMQCSP